MLILLWTLFRNDGFRFAKNACCSKAFPYRVHAAASILMGRCILGVKWLFSRDWPHKKPTSFCYRSNARIRGTAALLIIIIACPANTCIFVFSHMKFFSFHTRFLKISVARRVFAQAEFLRFQQPLHFPFRTTQTVKINLAFAKIDFDPDKAIDPMNANFKLPFQKSHTARSVGS